MTQSALLTHTTPADPLRSYIEDVCKDVFQDLLNKHDSNPKETSLPIEEKRLQVKRYGTRKQVASILNVSLPTVDNKVKTGELPALRFGSRVLFDLDAVDAALKQIKSDKFYNRQSQG